MKMSSKEILKIQKEEVNGAAIYRKVAHITDGLNREVLLGIASDEELHSKIWESYSGVELKPSKFRVEIYVFLSKVLGFTFIIKLLEKFEDRRTKKYIEHSEEIKEIHSLLADEARHEEYLQTMISEERLNYIGSVVLGINDALVELSGALVGFTFSLQNNTLIMFAGLVTGFAATLSMASSEYLSCKTEGKENPLKASIYTGIAYLITVVALVLPYMILPTKMYFQAFVMMAVIAVVIIAAFNFYISVAKNLDFKKRFLEMFMISAVVVIITYIFSTILKMVIGI